MNVVRGGTLVQDMVESLGADHRHLVHDVKIADVHHPDGTPAEEDPRGILKRVVARFADLGMTPMIGPELEFYVLEPDSATPNGYRRYGEATGNVHTAGYKGDPENTLLDGLRKQRRGRLRFPPALLRALGGR